MNSELLCHRCGHTWPKRKELPKLCPHCAAPKWQVPRTRLACAKCGAALILAVPDAKTLPKACAECGATDWYKPQRPVWRDAECRKCGNRWKTSAPVGHETECPKCHTLKPSQEAKPDHLKCGNCGHEWHSTSGARVRCKKCNTQRDGLLIEVVANRPRAIGGQWVPLSGYKPLANEESRSGTE